MKARMGIGHVAQSENPEHIFWDIFKTSKNVTEYGPTAPYLLQKYFKRDQTLMATFPTNMFSESGYLKI